MKIKMESFQTIYEIGFVDYAEFLYCLRILRKLALFHTKIIYASHGECVITILLYY